MFGNKDLYLVAGTKIIQARTAKVLRPLKDNPIAVVKGIDFDKD